jgi:hypothetical protein
MRHRRFLIDSRKAGFSAAVSDTALIAFTPIDISFAQYGISPQRISPKMRFGALRSWRIVATSCVGATFHRAAQSMSSAGRLKYSLSQRSFAVNL